MTTSSLNELYLEIINDARELGDARGNYADTIRLLATRHDVDCALVQDILLDADHQAMLAED